MMDVRLSKKLNYEPKPAPEPVDVDNELEPDDIKKKKFAKIDKPEEKQFVKVRRTKDECGGTNEILIDLSQKREDDSFSDELDYQLYNRD